MFQILTAAILLAAMANPWCARCDLQAEAHSHDHSHDHEHHDCGGQSDREEPEHDHDSHEVPEISVAVTAFKPLPGESNADAAFSPGHLSELERRAINARPPDPPPPELTVPGAATCSVAAKFGVFLI